MGACVDRKGATDIQGRKGIDVEHALGVETIDLALSRGQSLLLSHQRRARSGTPFTGPIQVLQRDQRGADSRALAPL
jgi:hypothetical protein